MRPDSPSDAAISPVLYPAMPTGQQIENAVIRGTPHPLAANSHSHTIDTNSEPYLSRADHTFEVLTTDLEFTDSCAPIRPDGVVTLAVPSTSESDEDSSWALPHAIVDRSPIAIFRGTSTVFDAHLVENFGNDAHPYGSASLQLASPMRNQNISMTVSPLSSTLLHVPTLLVDYYFQKVCRECSTFDSSANPFRSKISEMRHMSAPVHYVIQSLAAAKLADDMPRMKVVGLEAQGQALQTLKEELFAVETLHDVSDEVLYTLLLLGMTTSWHAREDLGLEYFYLARRIIRNKSRNRQVTGQPRLEFFEDALTYWTMITSMVSRDIETSDTPVAGSLTVIGPPPRFVTEGIMPHPWAGISPRSLQLFGQVLQLIQRIRGGVGIEISSPYSKARVNGITGASATAEALEADCWSVSIPSVDQLIDTGDPHTPALHYVLTAKAYLLSTLLHIYMIFPDVLEARIQSIAVSKIKSPALESDPCFPISEHVIHQSELWSQRLPGDHQDAWLKDVGIQIVECLEGIDSRSSTRAVHPPLLLSVASALTLTPTENSVQGDRNRSHSPSLVSLSQLRHEVDPAPCQMTEALNTRVYQCRSFLISRLETMQAAMRFHAIENVLRVVKEIWTRSDAGQQNTFWMDVMSELRCETIFG